ncbi:Polysaccharide biosynthesis C-terminal domain-containing protein [Paenibacillus sp. UNCCL117]|uniref:putative polysaccharide biosynthesis protein n=1 Tax=unclassified Paenibacillus TaxID=185978 RepID=UPI0008910BB5|nr:MULTISPECIES: polysaccharide biosynthesis protein [unclassified Paenibacillus]SDE53797.1 Polysaccharide biosynthesis C-terminal domain-containing protein [Paenibacillus sp. cl123]SFW68084.1 Polysaccharide biosynthesis C-terminal domain-containing protein [Paenibacillus sp. UNCCL117]
MKEGENGLEPQEKLPQEYGEKRTGRRQLADRESVRPLAGREEERERKESKLPAEGAGQPGASAFLHGAALLGIAAVVSKLLGTLQKIPLQNLAGDTVFGVYNAVYPLYTLILFLATAGFPLVVSKFVSEYAVDGRLEEARQVLRVSALVLMATGAFAFACLFLGAGHIAVWMGAPSAAPAIRSVSFALLVVPFMSALRGYFQGCGRMAPTAWSQVVEQTVRVAVMLALLLLLLRLGSSEAAIAAGATFGSSAGALAGLAVMLAYWRKDRLERQSLAQSPGYRPEAAGGGLSRSEVPAGEKQTRLGDWQLAKKLAAYALPVCLGSLAVPILGLVDAFTLPRLLGAGGLDEGAALYQYGLYNHGQPLVQLVAMVAASMTAALVPAIAEASHRGDLEAVRSRAAYALRATLLIGLAASFGLALLAEPLNMMFFRTTEGTYAMRVLSFTAMLTVVNLVAGSVLQGLGAMRAPAVYLLAAALVKLAGNAVLVPRYGIDGAAWAAVGAFALAAALTLAHALRAARVPAPRGRAVMAPLLAIGAMTAGLLAVTPLLAQLPPALPPRGEAAVTALGGVAAGALVYALALLVLRVITERDLQLVPQLRGKPTELLRRLRLLR